MSKIKEYKFMPLTDEPSEKISKERIKENKNRLSQCIINGDLVYDTEMKKLSEKELLNLYNKIGNANILSLFTFSCIMKETNDKKLSLKLNDLLAKIILWLEYGLKIKYNFNELSKGLVKAYKRKKGKINNMSLMELFKEIYD